MLVLELHWLSHFCVKRRTVKQSKIFSGFFMWNFLIEKLNLIEHF